MNESPQFSFEILHLISVFSVRFDTIFEKCELSALQMYVLAYIVSHGQTFGLNRKIVLRDHLTKILKRIFSCSDDLLTEQLTEMREDKFIDDLHITKEQKMGVFNTDKGRRRVLAIEKKGVKKVELLLAELRRLHLELIRPKSKLLCTPDTENHGIVGEALIFFLTSVEKAGTTH